jgi:hypothetical protein
MGVILINPALESLELGLQLGDFVSDTRNR